MAKTRKHSAKNSEDYQQVKKSVLASRVRAGLTQLEELPDAELVQDGFIDIVEQTEPDN